MENYDYDFVIIGSGFGGSVAALRLVEKGYKVAVLEAGKRFADDEFPKSNWNLKRYLFMPRLGLKGIMRMDFLRGLAVLSGAGVGGGSLVYANTLIEPERESFFNGSWPERVGISDWHAELAPHYKTASTMLGVTMARDRHPADQVLRDAARSFGRDASYHPVQVGVYYGESGKTRDDPYFGGEGPARRGCTECGACMIGCREGAKNTLVKNYLFFAEKYGAIVVPEAEVSAVIPLPPGGYQVDYHRPGVWSGPTQRLKARQVVLAAGVLGTMRLLLRCRDEIKTLPKLSGTLGTKVRTNSEALLGVRVLKSKVDYSKGVAIACGFSPDANTKVETVRYPAGSDFIGLLTLPLYETKTLAERWFKIVRFFVCHPIKAYRFKSIRNWAKETIVLLVMQNLDNKLNLRWLSPWYSPWRRSLTTSYEAGRPPVQIPIANQCAQVVATNVKGSAGGSLMDASGMSFTAHILGGCPMGLSNADSVIDQEHRVHSYPGLFVLAGAAVPANLGVNPSLTITAMAERAMAKIQPKPGSLPRSPIGIRS